MQVAFGGESVKLWRELNAVRLFLDVRFLDAMMAEALGVDRNEPIVVVVTFGDSYIENDAVQ